MDFSVEASNMNFLVNLTRHLQSIFEKIQQNSYWKGKAEKKIESQWDLTAPNPFAQRVVSGRVIEMMSVWNGAQDTVVACAIAQDHWERNPMDTVAVCIGAALGHFNFWRVKNHYTNRLVKQTEFPKGEPDSLYRRDSPWISSYHMQNPFQSNITDITHVYNITWV